MDTVDRLKTRIKNSRFKDPIIIEKLELMNNKKIYILCLVAMPLYAILLLNSIFIISPETEIEKTWQNGLIISNASLLIVFVIACLIFKKYSHYEKVNNSIRIFQMIFFYFVCIAGIIITVIDQMITTAITPFIIACVLNSLIVLIKPRKAFINYLLIFIIYYHLIELVQIDPNVLTSNRINGMTAVAIGIVLSTILWQINYSNIQQKIIIEKQNQDLKEKNKELEIYNTKILDSINYAKKIQNSILPKNENIIKSFKEYFVLWKPRDIVGGDFYWYKETEEGFLIAVVDCTGHGVPGALMTMTANATLNRIIDLSCNNNPAQILKELNIILKSTLHNNTSNGKMDDGLDIALCYIIPKQRKLIYSGAGISLYYSTEQNKIDRIKCERQSIGYQRSLETYEYNNHEVEIKENQVFYISSDGYKDQNGQFENKRLGRNKFIEILQKNCEKNLNQQKEALELELQRYMGYEEQRDDITVLGFRVL